MSVEVRIPTVLQKAVGGAKIIRVEGRTVGELLANLGELHPAFRRAITMDTGELHRFVNVYINDEDIRFLGLLDAPVAAGDVVSILPALAGGC
ncbi:MAG: MoaD/ThiS family protein [Dehalococcoidia bacterium]|nr:MoaD/ThiS family protein [Dehalococcoidia bacterium]